MRQEFGRMYYCQAWNIIYNSGMRPKELSNWEERQDTPPAFPHKTGINGAQSIDVGRHLRPPRYHRLPWTDPQLGELQAIEHCSTLL